MMLYPTQALWRTRQRSPLRLWHLPIVFAGNREAVAFPKIFLGFWRLQTFLPRALHVGVGEAGGGGRCNLLFPDMSSAFHQAEAVRRRTPDTESRRIQQ